MPLDEDGFRIPENSRCCGRPLVLLKNGQVEFVFDLSKTDIFSDVRCIYCGKDYEYFPLTTSSKKVKVTV